MALSAKQLAFIDAYMINKNATDAARAAGYSEKTARTIGSRLLTKIDIKQEIAKREKELRNKYQITQETVIEELAKSAFADLDINKMKFSDKLKALELLCRNLGILDGAGADKSNPETFSTKLLSALRRIGTGENGGGKRSDSPGD